MDRGAWFSHLARSVLECIPKRDRDALVEACDEDSLLAAWLVVHVAVGHVDGVTATEIAGGLEAWRSGHDWSTTTVALISAFRCNGLPPQINEHLRVGCDSLLLMLVSAHGYETIRPDLLAYEGQKLTGSRQSNNGQVAEPDPTVILARLPIDNADVERNRPFRISAPHLELHRRAVRAIRENLREEDASERDLAATYLRAAKAWLTPLELVSLFDSGEDVLPLDEALDVSRRILVVPYIMPGGWADVYPNESEPHTPGWLRDYVVTGGARSYKYTTGSLHTWILVSEGLWDRARIVRALREIERLGFIPLDDGFHIRLFLPEFAGDADESGISYQYSFDDPDQLRDALMMLATGTLRFEAFALEDGSLNFLGARSIPLPPDLISHMMSMAREALGAEPIEVLSRLGMMKASLSATEVQAEARFVASENARYEQLWNLSHLRPTADLLPIERESFEAIRRGYLAAESSLAGLLLGGDPIDEDLIVGTARRDFERAISAQPNQWAGTRVRLDVLEEHQAFLHVEYRDGALDWTAAGLGPEGPWYHWTSTQIDTRTADAINRFREMRHSAVHGRRVRTHERASAIDSLVSTLNESVAGMAEVLAGHDVASIVASPGADLDGVPVHLLALGELRASSTSYAPSTSFLASIGTEPRTGRASVMSYAGRDNDIPNVRVEASVVGGLQLPPTQPIDDARPSDLLKSGGSSVIHVSCHGLAVGRFGLRGLMLAPGDTSGFVSVADILGSDGFFDTNVVFLAACSSAVADHSQTLIQSIGGVDFAFIAAGARAVVSSQWDIGDVPSLIYAAEFHARLSETHSVRLAYEAAQLALGSDLATLSDAACQQLDQHWPSWRDTWRKVELRTHAVHWGAFRLSGLVQKSA